MRQIDHIVREAQTKGIVWLGGEMEFPSNQGWHAAYLTASKIAEACGYLVVPRGTSAFTVSGGDITGYFLCDWFSPDARSIVKVEHWTCEAGYLNQAQGVTP